MTDDKLTVAQAIEWLQQIPHPEDCVLLIQARNGKMHKVKELKFEPLLATFGMRESGLDWRIYKGVIISYEKDEI